MAYTSVPAQDKQEALPFLTEPHDALRLGVRSLKEDASVSHPVEAIQANVRSAFRRQYASGWFHQPYQAPYDLQTSFMQLLICFCSGAAAAKAAGAGEAEDDARPVRPWAARLPPDRDADPQQVRGRPAAYIRYCCVCACRTIGASAGLLTSQVLSV